jgi:hypothetical protein
VAFHRADQHCARRDDAGDRFQPFNQLPIKFLRRSTVISRALYAQLHGQRVCRIETQVDAAQIHETAQDERRAHEQDERQRDLAHNQRAAQTISHTRSAEFGAGVVESLVKIEPRGRQRRQQAEDHSGCERA